MFTGYSPETVDFLWGIRMNNNREWFLSHKQQYVDTLYEPTKALGKHLFEPFVDCPGELLKVSRIYRDARLHHPLPYKESLWICIRRDVQWWAENGCLYFEINPEGVDYGFFLYKPRPSVMEEFRRDIESRPQPFLDMIQSVEEAVGRKVCAVSYKRPKQPEDPRLAPYFAWREQIGCTFHEDFSQEVFGPQLGDRVRERLVKLKPLYDYFNRFCI